jgi:hypothetical protein
VAGTHNGKARSTTLLFQLPRHNCHKTPTQHHSLGHNQQDRTFLHHLQAIKTTRHSKQNRHKPAKISEEDIIDILKEEEEIWKLLTQTQLIDAATDGSHDPTTGKMAFGWVIAIGKTIVATGKGPAAGHPNLSFNFPDSDVTITAHDEIMSWSAQFQHVKSHKTAQTSTNNFPERLNQMADELATIVFV